MWHADNTRYHIDWTQGKLSPENDDGNETQAGHGRATGSGATDHAENDVVRDTWEGWDWYFSSKDEKIVRFESYFKDGTGSLESMRVTEYGFLCAREFMPSYEQLKAEVLHDNVKAVVKKYDLVWKSFQVMCFSLFRMVENHGVHVFSGDYPGMTIAQRAVLDDWSELTDCIQEIAKENKVELPLDFVEYDKDGKVKYDEDGKKVMNNLLHKAIQKQAAGSVEKVFGFMKARVVPFNKAAASVRECWKELCHPNFREVLRKALFDGSFVWKACDVSVNVRCLHHRTRKQEGIHLGTDDSFLDWKFCQDDEGRKQKWISAEKEIEQIRELEEEGFTSKDDAQLHFVCIEDAAKSGMDGIIRPLLLSRAPASFFEWDPVKSAIEIKWHKWWKKRAQWRLLGHLVFLALLTVYVSIVGSSGDLHGAEPWRQYLSTGIIVCTMIYGGHQLREEVCQLKKLASDGKNLVDGTNWLKLLGLEEWQKKLFGGEKWQMLKLLGLRWRGIRYYFSSRWNTMDLTSGALLLVFIPVLHCCELFHPTHVFIDFSPTLYRKALSVLVAVETLIAYLKVTLKNL